MAFSLSRQICIDSSTCLPLTATPPVSETLIPIFMGGAVCAAAAVAKRAAASAPSATPPMFSDAHLLSLPRASISRNAADGKRPRARDMMAAPALWHGER